MGGDSWPELAGRQLRYGDRTWELTGEVEVKQTGNLVEVEVEQVDDVRHQTAVLRFGLEDPPQSLNPGDLGEHFDSLERHGEEYRLVVKKDPRTYRYELLGIER